MQTHTHDIARPLPTKHGLQANSLRSRVDEVLTAIAVLGLVATIVDGEADFREVDSFINHFRKKFALSKRPSLRIIGSALKRIRAGDGTDMIDCACDTLNEHLNPWQKIGLFEALSDILVADGQIHEGEEYFLDFIERKLGLLDSLEKISLLL